MKIRTIIFWLFLILIQTFSFSQEIVGELNLQDSTQSHIIFTHEGDRMEGRITWISPTEIIFLFKDNKLVFKRDNLNRIEVRNETDFKNKKDNSGLSDIDIFEKIEEQEKETVNSDTPVITLDTTSYSFEVIGKIDLENPNQSYKLTTKTGDIFIGTINSLEKEVLQLNLDLGATLTYPFDAIRSIEAIGVIGNPERQEQGIIEDSKTYVLVTNRGDRFVGKVTGYESDAVKFELDNGVKLTFSHTEIQTIDIYEDYSGRSLFREDAMGIPMNGQQYLYLTPTAFNFSFNKGEYRNTQIFLNSVDYGISDNLSLGVGLIPFFVANIIDVRTKLTYDIGEYVHLGVGGHILGGFTFGDFGDDWSLGIAHGSASFGTPEKFLNVGYGKWLPFDRSDGFEEADLIMVGGSFRINKKGRIFGDLIKVNERNVEFGSPLEYTIIMLGGSWFNAKNRVDFGLFFIPPVNHGNDFGQAFGMPMISYARLFGKG